MSRRWKELTFAGAGLALTLSCGCASVTVTAANSINPVMFGSPKTMGSGTAAQESSHVPGGTVFRHRETVQLLVLCGYSCADSAISTTDPVDDERSPAWAPNQVSRSDNPARLDWKVLRATGEDPARRVDLTSIRCGGISAFLLFGVMKSTDCEVEGFVPGAQ